MTNNPFVTALAIVAAAGGLAYMLYGRTLDAPLATEDGSGPNLVIEIAGEANGTVVIDLLTDVAPKNAARLMELARTGAYDGVVFHRVIEGFMAQTGDVEFGRAGGDLAQAGMGKSGLPNLPPEFSQIIFNRGIVGMARSNRPDSANAQFFIMFNEAKHLIGEYTVVGRVIEGMDVVDQIKRGDPDMGGAVAANPDVMVKVTVEE